MPVVHKKLPAEVLPKDKVFETQGKVGDFTFDAKVASVFDDMVSRSVPYYHEMQRMIVELAQEFATDGSRIYDIGCSTGTTMQLLDAHLPDKNVTFVGIDNAKEMLKQAKNKFEEAQPPLHHPYQFKCQDVHKNLSINNASVVTLILTLQFVRPLYREKIIRRIYEGLNHNGCLLMIEKITSGDTLFNRLFIERYYDYKRRNGYTETEIAKKREALENVLIPYRLEENNTLLRMAGFRHVEVFFRWYNFCGILAVK